MVMNIYILMLVSLPEAFLNLMLFLLFSGNKDKLKVNKQNVIRFIAALILMLVATNFIRPAAPNVAVNIVLHMLAYLIIMLIIYRVNVRYALLSICFTVLIYTTVENAYASYIVVYISKGMENFANQYMLYPVYSMPTRICQLIAVCLLYKYDLLLVTKINKKFHTLFILNTLVLIVLEYFFLFLYLTYFNNMPLTHQIAFSCAIFVMAIGLNLLVFMLIYNAVTVLVQRGYDKYAELEEDAIFALSTIRNMLDNKEVDEAVRLIDKLTDKDRT